MPDTRLVVNGRFLAARQPTGMHRVARAHVDGLRARGVPLLVLAPPGVDDPRADAHPWAPRGRVSDHAWEQLRLPLAAHGRPVLSLCNTAPLSLRRAAVMVHDLAQRVGPQWFPREMRVYGALVLAAARRARVVLTPSRAVAEELARAGVDASRVHVVHNAVDPSFVPAPADTVAALRARLGLPRPYVVHVGAANPQKNAALSVRAHLRALQRGAPEHDLLLLGATSPTFGAVQLPAGAPSVRTLGYLDPADLPVLLSGAAALLAPSLYEGFGLPPLEAMACGTPALASDIAVFRETAPGAVHLPLDDVEAWAAAVEDALRARISAGSVPQWTWADASAALAEALAPLL
jgi:glycosyltransferase involved in cell wall biosynthesis